MEYVFDYSNGRGDIRWHDFFVHEGVATRILNLWASSRNAQAAREEVDEWAIEYISHAVAREARTVTKSKKLQTLGKKINQKIITSFSFTDMHDLLQEEMAPVAMTIFRAFSTSRHAHTKHTECYEFSPFTMQLLHYKHAYSSFSAVAAPRAAPYGNHMYPSSFPHLYHDPF